jgi:hypothetical protein
VENSPRDNYLKYGEEVEQVEQVERPNRHVVERDQPPTAGKIA